MKKHSVLPVLVAFAMATLLVTGTGAAYADEAAPSDPSTTASTPSTDPSTDPAASTDTSAPADPGTAPPSSSLTTTAPTAPRSTPRKASPMKLATVSPSVAVDVTVPCGDSDANSLVGGFEIDGDLCVNHSGEDWDNVPFGTDAADYTVDGFDDATSFTNGDSENNDPSTWHIDGPTPNGKSDIGTAYAYSKEVGGDVFGYFAFTNTSTAGGTQQYDVEYNQGEAAANSNGATVVVRQPGDLLFRFSSTGNAPLTFTDAMTYTLKSDSAYDAKTCFDITSSDPAGAWCTLAIPPGSFKADASDDGLFQEGSIEISAFFQEGTCSGVFGTTQIRSVTGGSFATSALKDYVFPLDVTTPSTCGSLVISKTDSDTGAPAVGAVFSISPDPRPGETGTLCVYDGPDASKPTEPAGCDSYYGDGTADGVVTIAQAEPGDYTVTEVVPPPGYMLNGDSTDSWTGHVGESEQQPVSFANRKIWLPLDVTKTATGHYGSHYYWTINKQIAPSADGPWSDTTSGAPLVKDVAAGDDTALYYRLLVSQDHMTTSSYTVDGTIHVDNPNDAAVTATIDESLPGCTIKGAADPATVSVPAGGADYSYTCALGNGPESAGTNTATVTWDMATYPQATDQLVPDTDPTHYTDSASADYAFGDESAVDKTVSVEDPYAGPGAVMVVTWGSAESGSYTSDVYSHDPEPTPGTCSSVVQNTATLLGDGRLVLGETSEYGRVCVGADLTAAVTAAGSLTRTFPWSVEKSTSTPKITVVAGVPTRASYDITVTAGDGVDSGWALGGTVTVTNPNDWQDVSLTGLTVGYSGSNDAVTADDCAVTQPLPASVPAGGQQVFDYTCTFDQQPSYGGDVTTALTWDAAAAHTPDGDVQPPAGTPVVEGDWAVSEVDPTVTVHDDRARGADDTMATLGHGAVYGMEGHRTVISYTQDLTGLPAAGSCATKVNTVWVLGDRVGEGTQRTGAVRLDADGNAANNQASVQVCTPAVSPPIVSPPQQQHPNVLPNTGGPDRGLFPAGLALVLAGVLLVAGDLRRRRHS
jgi:hypothetical protein